VRCEVQRVLCDAMTVMVMMMVMMMLMMLMR